MRRTLEERSVRNFFGSSLMIRWGIGLLFLGSLVVLTFLGGSNEFSGLSTNQISPRTVVARAAFLIEDSEETEKEANRRAEQARNFYRLNPDAYVRSLDRIKKLLGRINAARQGAKISGSRLEQIAAIWNEWSEVTLTSDDVQALVPLADKKAFLDHLNDLTARYSKEGILGDGSLHNPDTSIAFGKEPDDFPNIRLSKVSKILTVSQVKQRLLEQVSVSFQLTGASAKTIEKLLNDLVVPSLQFDLPASSKYQDEIRKGVETVQRQIHIGDVLVERGEKVTEAKMGLLKKHDAEMEKEVTRQSRMRQNLGTFFLIGLLIGVAYLTIAMGGAKEARLGNRELGLTGVIVVLHFLLCILVLQYSTSYTLMGQSVIFSMLPYCFGPMLATILVNRRTGLITVFLCTFLSGIITHFNNVVLLSSISSAIVGIHLLTPLRRRTKIYEAGLVGGGVAAAVNVICGYMWEVPWQIVGTQTWALIFSALAGSLLVAALLPIFESVFKVTTDLKWLELSDLHHPLLRRMILEAPGTYHHSLIVANLAERACEAIGANSLMARVCSYFHDIGKMNKPQYFCENQVGMDNPHDEVEPTMSALIIISHVKDGVDLALQNGLARPIIDCIQQHHGTSQVTYFYRMAKRNEEETRLGSKIMRMNVSDVPRVEEGTYRYPGPKPQTVEMAVVSLADAVEGASRCLLKPTPQKVEALIQEIIEERYRDGQLDECPLSFSDLKIVSDSFIKTILSMMHTRVSYPKDEINVDQPTSHSAAATEKMA